MLFNQSGSRSLEQMNHLCLVMLTMIAISFTLYFTRSIMVPFAFATFLFLALSPILTKLQTQWKLPRSVAVCALFAFQLVLIVGVVLIVTRSMQGFLESAELYQAKLLLGVRQLSGWVSQYGVNLNTAEITSMVRGLPLLSYAQDLTGGVINFLGKSLLVGMIVLFFILGEGQNGPRASLAMEVREKISRYLLLKTAVSFLTSVLVGLVLLAFQVELALMFTVLTFFLNFIPNIGSLIATLIVLPILAIQFGLSVTLFMVIGLLAGIQFSIGNMLEPKLMGESMDLHPVTVLLFLLLWGLVWGVAGMFMAVPITAILKMVMSRIPSLTPWAELFAGRWGETDPSKP